MSNDTLSPSQLARYIDHTLLKPEATRADIEHLCAEAREHKFASVCVNGSRVELAAHLLEDSDVKVATVAGFPLGAMEADAKRYEAEAAVDQGAQEIDIVMNIGRFKEGDFKYVIRDIRDVVAAAEGRIVKVILETCLLTNDEIVSACKLALEAEAHFVKTSTGFSKAGATIEHVRLMRETVGFNCGVKASGGIRDTATAIAMIRAGASRLGTSSGVAIVQGVESGTAGY
jgi:deoxyribose-phosphate aldolase